MNTNNEWPRLGAMVMVLAGLGVAACTTPLRTAPSPAAIAAVAEAAANAADAAAPATSPAAQMSLALRWMRRSAEYRALTTQTYAMAGSRLVELAPAISGTPWGVILDADETVLDNSMYAVRRMRVDSGYTEESWSAWVRDTAATAIPGAVEFTRRVHELGGRVVIVTNRADSLCALTRVNLRRAGFDADLVLCQTGPQTDKNPRFEAVERGTASPSLPALTVVEWLGDNIQDFPRLTQAVRSDPAAYALFGRRYFALPNPTYGSWESNTGP